MMLHPANVLAIVLMACATYATRTLGYAALGHRALSPRTRAVLDAAPGCVLIAVIAPAFVSSRPADLVALGITLLAAIRLPMMAVVAIGIAAAACCRFLLG
jgi:uncharacterized membrane protein